MDIRGTDFVMYQVADMARSVAFYRDVLGMTVEGEYSEGMWTELTATPTTLALYKPEDGDPKSGGASIALAVSDVGVSVEELKGKGVQIAWEKFESPVCYLAAVCDPDGNMVVLHQRKDGTCG